MFFLGVSRREGDFRARDWYDSSNETTLAKWMIAENLMADQNVDRRDFHKLTLAAFSGMVAGSLAGCGKPAAQPKGAGTPPTGKPDAAAPKGGPAEIALTDEQVKLLTDDVHVCRGLNACKGQGRSKDNDCAGKGTCASVADSSCGGNNECATLGGCGNDAGLNECKGKGGCHVPLMKEAWPKARAAFESAMKKAGKEVGAAPALPEKS